MKMAEIVLDMVPRYTPDKVMVVIDGRHHGYAAVIRVIAHPPNTHPKSCIRDEYTAIELITAHGSRWYGCEKAWINSELRMVVQGFNVRFEEMAAWEKAGSE